jgi:hypothetical protein
MVDSGTAAPAEADLAPYWDLLPLDSQPEGGWKTEPMEQLGFALQYPAAYDEGECGRPFVDEKADWTVVGFDGGAIRIRILHEAWTGDLADHALQGLDESGAQLLTVVEPFSIDGVPAVRYIVHEIPGPRAPQYRKYALAASEGRLYTFEYSRFHGKLFVCDAPPLSEEAVYEHLLTTFEFAD